MEDEMMTTMMTMMTRGGGRPEEGLKTQENDSRHQRASWSTLLW